MATLSAYLFILFGISIIFYLMGYTPLLFEVFAKGIPERPLSIIETLREIFRDPLFLMALGISVVGGVMGGMGGYGVMYAVPIIILILFANILVLPTSYLVDATIPWFIRAVITVFFNLFLLLAIIGFVKGGQI